MITILGSPIFGNPHAVSGSAFQYLGSESVELPEQFEEEAFCLLIQGLQGT